jgi:hypothetical protein
MSFCQPGSLGVHPARVLLLFQPSQDSAGVRHERWTPVINRGGIARFSPGPAADPRATESGPHGGPPSSGDTGGRRSRGRSTPQASGAQSPGRRAGARRIPRPRSHLFSQRSRATRLGGHVAMGPFLQSTWSPSGLLGSWARHVAATGHARGVQALCDRLGAPSGPQAAPAIPSGKRGEAATVSFLRHRAVAPSVGPGWERIDPDPGRE